MYFVYILFSPASDKFYIGQTHDIELRLKFHNELTENSFTAKYRPWIIKCSFSVESRSQAMKIEKYIKGRKSRVYLERLISDQKVVEKLLLNFEGKG